MDSGREDVYKTNCSVVHGGLQTTCIRRKSQLACKKQKSQASKSQFLYATIISETDPVSDFMIDFLSGCVLMSELIVCLLIVLRC